MKNDSFISFHDSKNYNILVKIQYKHQINSYKIKLKNMFN